MTLPFDRVHLATFTQGDPKVERELLETFAVNARVHLKALKENIDAPDWPDLAHRFKGAASGIGMRKLAQLCAAAETMDPVDAAQPRTDILGHMQNELDELDAYLAD
ncbi:MAG: Hpt domain-containing protein [Sphingomonadales bacterium]